MTDPGTTQFWRVRELGGMELLQSSFLDPAYPRHTHATCTIGAVDFGTVIRRGKDGTSVLPAGSIYAFDPGDVHRGHAAGARPIRHRTFYPSSEALARFPGDVGLAGAPALPHSVLNDGPRATPDASSNISPTLDTPREASDTSNRARRRSGEASPRRLNATPTETP